MKHQAAKNRDQFPLSTVCVRWHGEGYYTPLTLYRKFHTFGDIEQIVIISSHSANIVFENLTDACAVISEKFNDSSGPSLFCYWLHKTKSCRSVYGTGIRLKVVNDELINPTEY